MRQAIQSPQSKSPIPLRQAAASPAGGFKIARLTLRALYLGFLITSTITALITMRKTLGL
jgi:hypothetical protein